MRRLGGRLARGVFAALVALAAAGCGARPPEPPPRVGREDPLEHLARIGKVWARMIEDQGVLQRDPLGVVSFTVHEEMTFILSGQGAPKRAIARDEVFVLATGEEAHCKVEGSLPLVVRAFWKDREVRVALESAGGRLPRRCTQGALPAKQRDVGAWSAVYALRDDRLVPLEPPTLREALLPQ